MSIETIILLVVGSAATLFFLSFARWLWRQAPAPLPEARRQPPAQLGPPPDAQQRWMTWAEPGAPPPPPSPERLEFERAELEPVSAAGRDQNGDIDGARTMFFFKKSQDKTEIFAEERPSEVDEDAPVRVQDQLQTIPNQRAKASAPTRSRPPPPPPPPPPRKR